LTANGANIDVGSGKDIAIDQVLENAAAQSGTLTKLGVGKLTLNAQNTYSGQTTVSNGTLEIGALGGIASTVIDVANGATLALPTAGYTIASNQTLKGGGAIAGGGLIMGGGSTLAPGASPGTMTLSNSLTLASGAFFHVELWQTNSFDQVLMDGDTLTLGGATLQVLGDAPAFAFGTTFAIVKGFGTLDPSTFSNGAVVTGEVGNVFSIGYGTVNSDEITLTVIPEPAALGTMGMLALIVLLRRRLRA
jgi:fibronectin-binding autotransporter adhesin